jgi:photosystem II stability/assembly factor-like uncharacterized protein
MKAYAKIKSIRIIFLIFVIAVGGSSGVSQKTFNDLKRSPDVEMERDASQLVVKTAGWQFELFEFKKVEGDVDAAFFLDEKKWWIASQRSVFRSINGGASWDIFTAPLPENSKIKKIQFITEQIGWILIQSKPSDSVLEANLNRYWLFGTDDGGKHWRLYVSLEGVYADDFFFSNATNGWLTGNKFVNAGRARFEAYFIQTNNGGKNWEDLSPTLNERVLGNEFLTVGLSVGKDQLIFASTADGIFRIEADGVWNRIALKGMPDRNRFFKIGKTSSKTWLAGNIKNHGLIYTTLISGELKSVWQMYLLSMAYFSEIVETPNGKLAAAGYLQEFPDPNYSSVVQEKGVVMETVDFGKNWSVIYKDGKEKIRSIYPLALNKYLVVGETGSLGILRRGD